MPRKNRNNGVYGTWEEDALKNAVRSILIDGMSKKKASKIFSIPRTTLIRHVELAKQGGGVQKKFGTNTVLTDEQELELVALILEMESRLYGLTPHDVCSLVYRYCKSHNIRNSFCDRKKEAGRDWLRGFLSRNNELSLRKPEAVSMQRAAGFNKSKVDKFYQVLESMLFDNEGNPMVPPENIYNVDESGYTVVQKPRKIIARKGKKNVGCVTSAERGKTITTVCCMSAAGSFVPPMFIFPRIRMRTDLMDHAPAGALGTCTKSGWINDEKFTEWFNHFLKSVQPKERPQKVLLIMDGHASHTRNLEVIELARQNNVSLLCLPSHCTHRLQPLDVSFFKSLNSNYDEEVRVFLRDRQRRVLESDIPLLFSGAYEKSACLKNAASGFAKTGIYPFRSDTFTDEDFLGAAATDKPLTLAASSLTPTSVSSEEQMVQASDLGLNFSSMPTQATLHDGECSVPVSEPVKGSLDSGNINCDENVIQKPSTSMRDLIPIPSKVSNSNSSGKTVKKRKVNHAAVITSSPYKNDLAAAKRDKNNLAEVTKTKSRQESVKDSGEHSNSVNERKKKPKPTKQTSEHPIIPIKSMNKTKSKQNKAAHSSISMDETTTNREYKCVYCNDVFEDPPVEPWSQCSVCLEWCHESCVPNCKAPFPRNFACHKCSSQKRK
jgi:DDE superfamily endonuclease/helix-turn-helix, Psq domain